MPSGLESLEIEANEYENGPKAPGKPISERPHGHSPGIRQQAGKVVRRRAEPLKDIHGISRVIQNYYCSITRL
jgi:hypothetical protein